MVGDDIEARFGFMGNTLLKQLWLSDRPVAQEKPVGGREIGHGIGITPSPGVRPFCAFSGIEGTIVVGK